MGKTMTPSATTITAGQIGKIQDLLGAALRKSGLQSDPTQQVIETQGESLAAELLAQIRRRVEAVSNMIVRRVKVDRTRTPQESIKATKRVEFLDDSVVTSMPRGEGEEVEVCFFKIGRYVSDADLEKEYELHGLIPVDPYSLAAVNEEDLVFADDHPNGTHWKNADGKWCYAAFLRWYDDRLVHVNRHVNDWGGGWWVAGLRK